jgi:hypothetical protein
MPVRPSPGSRQQPVHAFRPTAGTVMGTAGLAAAAVVVVVALVTDQSATGIRVALVAALVGVLIWMVLLRPRVTAYADTLVLHNMASDTFLPLAGIESAAVGLTLHVWVDGRRYTCPGIGRSTRSMMRAQRRGAVTTGEEDYASFVESTIEGLARSAQRDLRGDPSPVRREWAVRELAALAVLTLALAVSFVL